MPHIHIYHNTRLAESYVVGPSDLVEMEYGNASELPYTLLTLADGGEYVSCDGFTSRLSASKRAWYRANDKREVRGNFKRQDYAETDGQFYDPIEDWRTTL